MAQSRYYSSTAQPTVLTGSITPASTTIVVAAVTGFPVTTPYVLALDYATASEELVLVTAAAGTSLTVTRAYDGTSATSHNVAANVRHTWAAADGNDSRFHEGSTGGVHGIAGISAVVGTTDTQTLSNKTLTAPIITSLTSNNATLTGTVTGSASYTTITLTSPTITGTVGGSASYTSPTITGTVAGGASYTAPTITGNVPGDPTFTAGLNAGSTGQASINASGIVDLMPTVSFTPTWTSSGTPPVVGNGTLTGNYFQFGKMTWVNIVLTLGSTSTLGTGNYVFNTPGSPANASLSVGTARVFKIASADIPLTASFQAANQMVFNTTAGSQFGASNWGVQTAGDQLTVSIVYMAV